MLSRLVLGTMLTLTATAVPLAAWYIGGSAGVNGYFASYESDGASLIIGPAGSTMMMGLEDLMEQEMSFLSALGSAGSFSVDGDALEILSEGGNLLFTAVK